MSPILWLDKQLLKFFNKIVKDINWLFGVGQFFMARLALILALLVSFLGLIHNSKSLYLELLVFFLGLIMAINFHFMLERDLTEDQLKEAKSLLRFELLKTLRFYWIIVNSILLITPYAYYFRFYIIWIYFLSVDFPPFRKSQAWQKIKDWLGSRLAQPKLAPIPVRSN